MRLAGISVKEVMEQLNIRNKTQVKTWMRWYHNDELNRLEQPVGKQYSYGKGPEYASELEMVKAENRFLKQQLDLLKKYKDLEEEVSPKIIVEWIESIRGEISVTQACAWVGLPRATYYRWKAEYRSVREDHMVEKIRELCMQHKFRYGYWKITALLQREHTINHKRVQRIMQPA
ncbi:hypothetical protein D3C73_1005130 [compost metagenome]